MTLTVRLCAGAILAGFLALIMVAAAACWSGEVPPVVDPSLPPGRHMLRSYEISCDRLEAAGKLPQEPTVPTSGDYWFDRSVAYEDYAARLRGWAITAIAVCTP